jgi:hypothetical protein
VFLPSGATVAGILNQLDIDKNLNISLPSDSNVKVDLSNSPVELLVEWYDPEDGTVVIGDKVQGGTTLSFVAPFSGDAVLYIYTPRPE